MILRKLLGEVIQSLGIATQEQIELALLRQQQMVQAKAVPEEVQRTELISQARSPGLSDYLISSSSTSKASVEFGGIVGGLPAAL